MDKKKLLIYLVLLMILLFLADRIGSRFYWYYTIWWFDMPMHFFGGLWVGLFFSYIFLLKSPHLRTIFKIILCILAIGILWEIFEFKVHNIIAQMPFSVSDTFSDLFFDLSGGMLAILYVARKIMPADKSTVHPVVEL